MKIYEYIKKENKRTFKLFGFPIMEQTSDYITAECRQSFFNGLVATVKVNNPLDNTSRKEIKFLGHTFSDRVEENNYCIYTLFGKEIYRISLLNKFKKEFFKYFSDNDDIYILRCNSGEAYLTLTYVIDALIKSNGSKKPLLLATKKYHIDLIKMICPDIPYVYAKNLKIKLTGKSFNIDKYRFFLLFDRKYFNTVKNDIKNNPLGEKHYFKSILDTLNITREDISMRKISVPLADEKSMLEKVNNIGLDLNKFVFIAPEAKSCRLYDEDFWCILINLLKKKGYDVFVNVADTDLKLKEAIDYKSCFLTYSEAFALAKRSRKIVSLRSGFTEFLLQTGVPIDVLYTRFGYRCSFDYMDINHFMSGFGLSQIPYTDMSKINEFNTFEISPAECINKIMESM